MPIENLLADVRHIVEQYLNNECRMVKCVDIKDFVDIDPRGLPNKIWIAQDKSYIAIRTSYSEQFDYYGGFEYASETYVIGEYKFYTAVSNRVFQLIHQINNNR